MPKKKTEKKKKTKTTKVTAGAKKRAKAKKETKKKKSSPKVTVETPSVAETPEITEEERREKLRRFLLTLREKILSEAKTEIAKYIRGETKEMVETALDDGDWSVVDLAEDISLKQLSIHRENLMKIDEALRKLEQGTYGICEECGEEITEERLKILPFAIYCRECQERKEIMEKIEKEYE